MTACIFILGLVLGMILSIVIISLCRANNEHEIPREVEHLNGVGFCPECGRIVQYHSNTFYCDCCGQKIKWSK